MLKNSKINNGIVHNIRNNRTINSNDSIYDILQISHSTHLPSNSQPQLIKHQLQTQLISIQNVSIQPLHATNCMNNDVLHCPHSYQLTQTMHNYSMFMNTNNDKIYKIEQVGVLRVLNNFLHLLQTHDNDQQFEMIQKRINLCCDIKQCKIFKRMTQNVSYHSRYRYQILDKIHCYYEHCHDVGNRLTIKEKISIIDSIDNKNNAPKNYQTVNKQIKKINNILSAKQEHNKFMDTRAKKFNRMKSAAKKTSIDRMYSVGVEFKYGYPNEVIVNDDNYIPVRVKYKDLKQELLQNKISTVSTAEFDTEYRKAQVHYRSDYRKQKYANILREQILSLMFYCNFDGLEFEFSKTYREQQQEHRNFYHLGQSIKSAIHQFGTRVMDGNIAVFYHGIGEQLLFPNLLIRIDSPMSTSSQFEVANNFTNNNSGLIVEFGAVDCPAKYFSLAWLSDYAYESEYLFIHNEAPLEINNIMASKTGSEFKEIITTLKIMDKLFKGKDVTQQLSSRRKRFIIKFCQHQLSYCNPQKYRAFNSLHNYARRMVDVYCEHEKRIVIDSNLKHCYPKLFRLLFHSKLGWVNLKVINQLFPNVEYIVAREVNLCSHTMKYLLHHLETMSINSKLNKIKLLPNQSSTLSIDQICSQYENKLNQLSFICYRNDKNDNWLCLKKKPKFKITLPQIDLDASRSVSIGSNSPSIFEISSPKTKDKVFYYHQGHEAEIYVHDASTVDNNNNNNNNNSTLGTLVPSPYPYSSTPSEVSSIHHVHKSKITPSSKKAHLDISNSFPYYPDVYEQANDEKESKFDVEAELAKQKITDERLPPYTPSLSSHTDSPYKSYTSSSSYKSYRYRSSTTYSPYKSYTCSSIIQSNTMNEDNSSLCVIDSDDCSKEVNRKQNKKQKKKKQKKKKKKKEKKTKTTKKKFFNLFKSSK